MFIMPQLPAATGKWRAGGAPGARRISVFDPERGAMRRGASMPRLRQRGTRAAALHGQPGPPPGRGAARQQATHARSGHQGQARHPGAPPSQAAPWHGPDRPATAGGDQLARDCVTGQPRPHRLARPSVPGGALAQRGAIEVRALRDRTRVTVGLSCRPPAGAIGHALAALPGRAPCTPLPSALRRMKALREAGQAALSSRHIDASDRPMMH